LARRRGTGHDQCAILVESLSFGNEFEVSVAATSSEADALLGNEDARFHAVTNTPPPVARRQIRPRHPQRRRTRPDRRKSTTIG